MERFDLLRISAHRSPAYAAGSRDPEVLASAINEPSGMRPITLTDAYALAVDAGATDDDLQASESLSSWLVDRLAAALAEGNLVGAVGLIRTASAKAPALSGRLSDIVAARAVRHLDVVAQSLDYAAPVDDATGADVAAALAVPEEDWA